MSTLTYLDNNATTRPDERVVAAMLPLLTEQWGNPSSAHHFGAQVAARVEEAREHVAALLGARPSEIVFTSGGTEADNAAIRGVLGARPDRRHVVISAVEHHAIFELAEALEHEGVAVTRVGVDGQGRLDVAAVTSALRPDTAVVSVMLANNETGVIYPVREIAAAARAHGIPVHTDAVNAVGKMPVQVEELGVALLSLSGHKIHGPKGVGALYVRRGTPLRPFQIGGSQERQRRGGTLNAPGIVGLGEACRILCELDGMHWAGMRALRDRLEAGIRARVPEALIVGSEVDRLPNTTCVCFPGVLSEPVVLLLSEAGVCVSSGAACSSGSIEPSHVLQAMHIPPHIAQGEVRFSLSRDTTEADIDRALDALPEVLRKVAVSGV